MPMLRGPPSAGEQGRSRGPRGASAVAQAGSEGGWIQGSFSSQNSRLAGGWTLAGRGTGRRQPGSLLHSAISGRVPGPRAGHHGVPALRRNSARGGLGVVAGRREGSGLAAAQHHVLRPSGLCADVPSSGRSP